LQYQTEKFLAENGEKIPEDKKTELNDALVELRSALGGSDIEAVKTAHEKVSRLSQEIGGAMYAQAQQDPTAGAAGAAGGAEGSAAGAASSDDDVVDAEIVDDEKPDENK